MKHRVPKYYKGMLGNGDPYYVSEIVVKGVLNYLMWDVGGYSVAPTWIVDDAPTGLLDCVEITKEEFIAKIHNVYEYLIEDIRKD